MLPLRRPHVYMASFNDVRRTAGPKGRALPSANAIGVSHDTGRHFFSAIMKSGWHNVTQAFGAPIAPANSPGVDAFSLPVERATIAQFASINAIEQAIGRPLKDGEGLKVSFSRIDYRKGHWQAADISWPIYSAKFQINPKVRAAEASGKRVAVVTFIESLYRANAKGQAVVWPDGSKHAYFVRAVEPTTTFDPLYQAHFNPSTIAELEHDQGLHNGVVDMQVRGARSRHAL